MEEPQLCMPQGSNALLVSNKADFAFTMTKAGAGSSTFPSKQASLPQVGSTNSIVKVESVSGALNYPPERYLPPSGPFFNQFRLSDIFGDGFFNKSVSSVGAHAITWKNVANVGKSALFAELIIPTRYVAAGT